MQTYDTLIIGGGPAGLTAAIYLARFHLSALVVHDGRSRASLIPLTRNHAGFPEGISGNGLVARMRDQALLYGAGYEERRIESLARRDGLWVANGTIWARTVLLATGVVNRKPPMDETFHAEALARGLLRYCPVCDGFEVTDKRVGVIGTGKKGAGEAEFLRSFTADVTLIAPDGPHDLDGERRANLQAAGIKLTDGPCLAYRAKDGRMEITLPQGPLLFDSVYPALGSDARTELAAMIGAGLSEECCLIADSHQRTNVEGVYAAGDVVLGLDQISQAMGQAGVAATTIRNDLAKLAPLRR